MLVQFGAFTVRTANYMDMGAVARAFVEARYKDFIPLENCSTDRAYPLPVSQKAVNTAAYVHKPVFAAVH